MSADLDFNPLEGGAQGVAGGPDDGAGIAELPPMLDEPRGPRPPMWRDPWFIAGGLFTIGAVVFLTSRPPRQCADCAAKARIAESEERTAGYNAEAQANAAAAAGYPTDLA